MSAQPKAKRPPTFYTTVETEAEVDIDPSELEEAGWVYVGEGVDGKAPIPEGRFEALVREFHDAEHDGPMVWCRHDLCMEVVQ